MSKGPADPHAGAVTAHRTCFARTGGHAPDMQLVCERFRLVEMIAASPDERGAA